MVSISDINGNNDRKKSQAGIQKKLHLPVNNNSIYTCKNESTRTDLDMSNPQKMEKLYNLRVNNNTHTDISRILKEGRVEIGDIEPIPKSVLYDPLSKGKYFMLKDLDLKFKVEFNRGINPSDATQPEICLAKYAQKVADEISNVGACYTGVKKTFLSAGVIRDYDEMPRGEAKDSIQYFEKHTDKFKKINVKKEDLEKLPAGRIVVFINKDDAGHIVITNGNGQGMSSATDNMGWLDFKGKDAKYAVYELTDGWKYNKVTRKLEFK